MKDYIGYAKDYLIYKLHSFDKSKVNNDFDVIELEDKLNNSTNINELHEASKLIATKGLKQITTVSNALKNFYNHLQKFDDELVKVDTKHIEHYINKVCINNELSFGTRQNYKNNIVSFLTYLDKEHKTDFKIEKIKVHSIEESKKSSNKLIDWLDTKTFIHVNKEILSYWKKDNDSLERNRDILIFRIFSFSGVLPNEMATLTLDSFVFKGREMFLNIDGEGAKKREIPLPKEKIIRYYNSYIKQREKRAETFFYSPSDYKKTIDTKYLNLVVKKLLDFTKVDVRDNTPKMLRKSYAIILNNEKGADGLTQPEQNIKYLLGLSNTTQLRELLKYATIEVVTASKVFDKMKI